MRKRKMRRITFETPVIFTPCEEVEGWNVDPINEIADITRLKRRRRI